MAVCAALREGKDRYIQPVGRGSVGVDREVSVMTPTDAKGLEFDAVVIVRPAEILTSHARGANDVYVALTRPTQALSVVYSGDLPAGLRA